LGQTDTDLRDRLDQARLVRAVIERLAELNETPRQCVGRHRQPRPDGVEDFVPRYDGPMRACKVDEHSHRARSDVDDFRTAPDLGKTWLDEPFADREIGTGKIALRHTFAPAIKV
jgi:hypothetical protein